MMSPLFITPYHFFTVFCQILSFLLPSRSRKRRINEHCSLFLRIAWLEKFYLYLLELIIIKHTLVDISAVRFLKFATRKCRNAISRLHFSNFPDAPTSSSYESPGNEVEPLQNPPRILALLSLNIFLRHCTPSFFLSFFLYKL
jgi:hypothetical protein